MEFKYYLGTKVFFGKDCIFNNRDEFSDFGKRAFIVTGKTSGKKSGALDDVLKVLNQLGISSFIFDRVENNPTLENVEEGGNEAAKFKADFVIGIGGGSPLDAAKAIAVLAVNRMDPRELYTNRFDKKPLPILAVPTTAGTGSEVTPYSVLTNNDAQTKMSFGNNDTFPAVAFLDPRYTLSMSRDTTVNTAIDALSHAIEGYLNKRSMPVSDLIAEQALKIFGECMDSLVKEDFNYDIREKLLYASMLAGMVIAQTGTTLMHGMGYSLTYFKDLPHGKANGLLMREYLKFNYENAGEKIDNILKLLNAESIDELGNILDKLLCQSISLSKEEIDFYASQTMKQKSTYNNLRNVTREDVEVIYQRSVG